jgi:hypothetical protein
VTLPLKRVVIHGEENHERELLSFVVRTRLDCTVFQTDAHRKLWSYLHEHRYVDGDNEVRLVIVVHEGRTEGPMQATRSTLRMLRRAFPTVPVVLIDLPQALGKDVPATQIIAGVTPMDYTVSTLRSQMFRKRGPKKRAVA